MNRTIAFTALVCMTMPLTAQTAPDPFLTLMTKAQEHAKAHGALTPVLSPNDATVLGDHPSVNIKALQQAGFKVVPWTTNDPAKIQAVLALHPDGLISDRPDILQAELAKAKAADPTAFAHFDTAAHRGGRGLRPENTLPSFESGLDHLVSTLETDTGVTTDHISLIWHDQFLNPQSCRKADGSAYTLENKIFTRDISMPEAQKTFICDKLHFGPDQKNDLALSPVSVAFAKKEGLISPYVPTYVEQLFRFVAFYVDFYKSGPGKSDPHSTERWQNAQKVRFNIETKIMPELPPEMAKAAGEPEPNHTVDPQTFVTVLCGVIMKNHMESRAEVQSFDFRTLQLVEEQFPKIPTYYLTGDPRTLSTPMTPDALRADK
ncbi:MAG TPA: glycerophosphodiester phosphodiesterase family protein [Granulicella sp.]